MNRSDEVILTENSFLMDLDVASGQRVVFIYNKENLSGPDERFGNILSHLSINALARSPQPPLALLFYGSGVRLSVKNDESAKALKSLQAKGTKICLCAASVEYLDLNYSDLIGEGVHAEEIMKLLQEADKVVTL